MTHDINHPFNQPRDPNLELFEAYDRFAPSPFVADPDDALAPFRKRTGNLKPVPLKPTSVSHHDLINQTEGLSGDAVGDARKKALAIGADRGPGSEQDNANEHRKQEIQAAIDRSPALAQYFTDTDRMAISGDDLENLSFIDQGIGLARTTLATPGFTIGGTLSGLAGIYDIATNKLHEGILMALNAGGFIEMAQALEDPRPFWLRDEGFDEASLSDFAFAVPLRAIHAINEWVEEKGEVGEELKKGSRIIDVDPEDRTIANDIVGGFAQIAVQATMFLATGGISSLAFLAGQGADQMQDDIANTTGKEHGKLTSDEELVVLYGAGVTAALNQLGLSFLFKRLPKAQQSKFIKAFGGFLVEGGSEFGEAVMHNVGALFVYDDDRQIFTGTWRDFTVGGIVGFGVGLFTPGGKGAKPKRGEKHTITDTLRLQTVMDEVDRVVKESKTNQRAPDLSREHRILAVENAGITEVWVDLDALVDYAKTSDRGAATVLAELGVTQDARVNDVGQVPIAGELFAGHILGTPAYDKLGNAISYKPGVHSAKTNAAAINEATTEMQLALKDMSISEELKGEVNKTLKEMAAGKVNMKETLTKASRSVTNVIDEMVATIQKKKIDGLELITEGRINELDVELAANDRAINAKNEQIDARRPFDAFETAEQKATRPLAGRPTKALNTELDNLIKKRNRLEKAQGQLALPDIASQPSKVGARENIKVKAGRVERLLEKAHQARVSALRAGFRKGAKLAREDMQSAQKELKRTITKSGLSTKRQTKFLKQLTNITSSEVLLRKIDKIQSRIAAELEVQRIVELRGKLWNELKDTKPQKGKEKKPTSQFGPEVQVLLDQARKAMKLTVKAANVKLDGRIQNTAPDSELAWETSFIAVAARYQGVNSSLMAKMVDGLKQIKEDGKAGRATHVNAEKRRAQVAAEGVFTQASRGKSMTIQSVQQEVTFNPIPGGPAVALTGEDAPATVTMEKTGSNKFIAQRVQRWLKSVGQQFMSSTNSWDQIVDIVVNKDGVPTDLGESLRMTNQNQNKKGRMERWRERFYQNGMDAYGVDSSAKVIQILFDQQVMVRINSGSKDGKFERLVPEKAVSVREDLIINRDMAITWYAQSLDDSISGVWTDPMGNGFSPEMVDAMNNLLDQNPKDRTYARGLVDTFYRSIYPEVNPVYRRRYGMNMPFRDFYSPIERDHAAKIDSDEGFHLGPNQQTTEEVFLRHTLPSAVKTRTEAVVPLRLTGAAPTAFRYMHDMATFVETSEHAAFLRKVFQHPKVKKAIADVHGKTMNNQIASQLDNFENGHLQQGGNSFERMFTYMHRGLSRTALGWRVIPGAKQLTTALSMGQGIPPGIYMKYNKDFLKNPKKKHKVLWDLSQTLRARSSSQQFAEAQMGHMTEAFSGWRHQQTLDNTLFAFTRVGDRSAFMSGAWAVYQHGINELKLTQSEAIRKMEDAINTTQQSPDLDKFSQGQGGGPLVRTLFQFMSARQSTLRVVTTAVRRFHRGKKGPAEIKTLAGVMAIHWVMIPSLVQWIANGLEWDNEDQLIAALLGQINNLWLIGDLAMMVANSLIADDHTRFSDSHPIAETGRQIAEGIIDVAQGMGDADFIEVLEGVNEMMIGVLTVFGIPLEQAERFVLAPVHAADGQIERALKEIVGMSDKKAAETKAFTASGKGGGLTESF